MPKQISLAVFSVILTLAAFTGIAQPQTTGQASPGASTPAKPVILLAGVERFDIVMLETHPVQVRVAVYGWMSDACTSIRDFKQVQEGREIFLKIYTIRPGDAICAQMTKRFRETYPLDTAGLPPGKYTLDISGKRQDFTLP